MADILIDKKLTGYIYSLRSKETDVIYIGSTTLGLKRRFILHNAHFNEYLKNKKKFMSCFMLMKYDLRPFD